VLWLADECIAVSLVRELRGAGHDVLYIAEFAASLSDIEVMALASREGRLLLRLTRILVSLSFAAAKPFPV
jgi:predicted nuclease of predicted toxin-antitoxin system